VAKINFCWVNLELESAWEIIYCQSAIICKGYYLDLYSDKESLRLEFTGSRS
jgi:hypothetical protein